MTQPFTTNPFKQLLLLLGFAPLFASAQLTVNHAEDFSIGDSLTFRNCAATGVQPGVSGAAVNWDFSSLTGAGTLTEKIVLPSSTFYGSQFPAANQAEKYSDHTYVFADKSPTESNLVGYVDSVGGLLIHYPNTALFMKRPFAYNDVYTDTFTTSFSFSGFPLHGVGIATTQADGYGTLVLPDATYTNVLRVKQQRLEVDTVVGTGNIVNTNSYTYVWFDNAHHSALLKIDSVYNPNYQSKSVSYLLDETPNGVAETRVLGAPLHASIDGRAVTVFGSFESDAPYALVVYAANGDAFDARMDNVAANRLSASFGRTLPAGVYQVVLTQGTRRIGTTKVIKAE